MNLTGEWRDKLATAVERMVFRTYPSSSESMRFAEAALVRYSVNATVPPHTDINPSKRRRALSFVCYLTDGYLGGELVIPGLNHHGIGQRGSLITFPSTELHWATQVTAGDKSVFVGFLESMGMLDNDN
ncbi:2OG-Fe(II) oxygenase [Paraburkholderia caledonica]|uniref:2OG-Fe(II) oxygenase n=1 Tax=Paraburkholderia caledonica TaxID=134536 RepID=UPI00137524B3|nr:2OG-Fe(II) oxygenase [Paraburkholderia caledonica]